MTSHLSLYSCTWWLYRSSKDGTYMYGNPPLCQCYTTATAYMSMVAANIVFSDPVDVHACLPWSYTMTNTTIGFDLGCETCGCVRPHGRLTWAITHYTVAVYRSCCRRVMSTLPKWIFSWLPCTALLCWALSVRKHRQPTSSLDFCLDSCACKLSEHIAVYPHCTDPYVA